MAEEAKKEKQQKVVKIILEGAEIRVSRVIIEE